VDKKVSVDILRLSVNMNFILAKALAVALYNERVREEDASGYVSAAMDIAIDEEPDLARKELILESIELLKEITSDKS
jgi:hypothetical protein